MAIAIRDEHLESLIDSERQRRGDATQAKTLSDLARERLREIEVEKTHGFDKVDRSEHATA
jgi:hypothetical protein